MAAIAMDERNTIELRARMFAELSNYKYAMKRATKVKANDGKRVTFIFHPFDHALASV